MTGIPSMSSSISTALQSGFAQVDCGAAELVAGTSSSPTGDTTDLRNSPTTTDPANPPTITGELDPTLAGIRDLMLGQMMVGASAVLLHAYRKNRSDLVSLLYDS